ncbi:MAG: hypothetical protein ABSG68_15680 [Thermoguttaceae bacterium]|jgi:hypothetical protein
MRFKHLALLLRFIAIPLLSILAGLPPATAGQPATLDNGVIRAMLNDGALVRLENTVWKRAIEIADDSTCLNLDGKPLALRGLKPTGCRRQAESVVYRFAAGDKEVEVIYELKAGWHFLSDPGVDSGNPRLREVEERQARRVRLSHAGLEAESRVDRLVPRTSRGLRRRRHGRAELSGLAR